MSNRIACLTAAEVQLVLSGDVADPDALGQVLPAISRALFGALG